jgi:hypothetical protein
MLILLLIRFIAIYEYNTTGRYIIFPIHLECTQSNSVHNKSFKFSQIPISNSLCWQPYFHAYGTTQVFHTSYSRHLSWSLTSVNSCHYGQCQCTFKYIIYSYNSTVLHKKSKREFIFSLSNFLAYLWILQICLQYKQPTNLTWSEWYINICYTYIYIKKVMISP